MSSPATDPASASWWSRLPLYVRIRLGMTLGVVAGLLFGPATKPLDVIAQLVLRVLGDLAPVLIMVAVIQAIMTAEIRGRLALRMVGMLLVNTLVAILVGLGVANLLRPGAGAHLPRPAHAPPVATNLVGQILDNV